MIDEKDIRKAATLTHNPALDAVANFAARNAFAAGIDWFKKALWHDASVKPEEGEQILYTSTEGGEIVDGNVTTTALYDFMPWDEVVRFCNSSEWWYIDALLPKGGEKGDL